MTQFERMQNMEAHSGVRWISVYSYAALHDSQHLRLYPIGFDAETIVSTWKTSTWTSN